MIERNSRGRFIKGNEGYWTNKERDQATKEKISQSLKGHIPWNKGKIGIYSEETRKSISQTLIKNPVKYWKGKYFSEIHRENLSKSHIGKKQSPETIKKRIKRGENHYNWKGGISNEPYSFNFNEELKELIRRRDKYKCQLCGMPECENIKKLCIHHIDYNKKNYSPDNLIALCGKCNPKVNFKRDYWRKYFQDKIKKIDLSA